MGHLDDGALRRLIDEPLAVGDRDRHHLEGCARCRAAMDSAAGDAEAVAALFATSAPTIDARAALASVQRRAAALPPTRFLPRAVAPVRFQLSNHARPLVIAGLAAALVAAMTVTGTAGDAVSGAVTLFGGSGGHVTPVAVPANTLSASEIAGLPDLSAYGTMTWDTRPESTSVDALAKAAAVGLTPIDLGPAYSNLTSTLTFVSQSKGTFKLDARKAAAAAVAKSTRRRSSGPALMAAR